MKTEVESTLLDLPFYPVDDVSSLEELVISKDTVRRVKKAAKKVLSNTIDPNIHLYMAYHHVFHLDSDPQYIFKIAKIGRTITRIRYENMLRGREICEKHQLNLLVIPRAKILTCCLEGGQITEVLAEERLDIAPSSSMQEQFFEECGDTLDEAVNQFAKFIFYSGYNDIDWRNNPVLNHSLNALKQRKLALVDFDGCEHDLLTAIFGDAHSRGLVRCVNERQGQMVLQTITTLDPEFLSNPKNFQRAQRVLEQRHKELEENRRLYAYYQRKGIIGKETKPIQIDDLDSLGLNLQETAMMEDDIGNPLTEVTMEQVIQDVIVHIDGVIQRHSAQDSLKTIRFVKISEFPLPFRDLVGKYVWCAHAALAQEPLRCVKKYWLHSIFQALVDKGHIFGFKFDPFQFYDICVQA